MQIVPKEISACMTTVAIENSKELAFRPPFTLFVWGFLDVEDDGDSVFIVVPYNSLVGVGGVGFNDTVFFG